MSNPLTWLSRRRHRYEPLITLQIYKERLVNNLNEFRKLAPHGNVAPVLKSNAYGHGLLEIAYILENERNKNGKNINGIPFFIVDSYFEALALRSDGIKTPLLIIGYTRPEIIMESKLRDLSFMVGDLETLNILKKVSHIVSIHLKIDTGMHRQGILPEEIDKAIIYIEASEYKYIRLDGLFSHLCDADNPDDSFTDSQIHIWNRIVNKFKNKFISIKYFHLSATDGHRFSPDIDANVSRVGLGLYGLLDGGQFRLSLNLKPVLEMKTMITNIKALKRGEFVGYGNTFQSDKDLNIATIPVGYYEGLDRRLSNIGHILVGPGQCACPIIGRVSMNISVIDISKMINVKIGTPVIVMSADSSKPNSIISMAKDCGTIPYEIAVHIPAQLKRIVI